MFLKTSESYLYKLFTYLMLLSSSRNCNRKRFTGQQAELLYVELLYLKSTPNCIVASFKKVLEKILTNSYKPLF